MGTFSACSPLLLCRVPSRSVCFLLCLVQCVRTASQLFRIVGSSPRRRASLPICPERSFKISSYFFAGEYSVVLSTDDFSLSEAKTLSAVARSDFAFRDKSAVVSWMAFCRAFLVGFLWRFSRSPGACGFKLVDTASGGFDGALEDSAIGELESVCVRFTVSYSLQKLLLDSSGMQLCSDFSLSRCERSVNLKHADCKRVYYLVKTTTKK